METDSGTVMVVRTAAGVPEAASWAAARAEASRDALPSAAGTPGAVSGKNPRPCLPEVDERTPRCYPRTPTGIAASPARVTGP